MSFTKVNSLNEKKPDVDYLKVSDLVEGLIYTKVALVSSAEAGLTKTSSGYAKFYLKDVDSNVISAFLFDVKDFAFSGITLAQLRGKPVEVRFVTQILNGSMSLLVDGSFGIKEWKGEFDRKKFVDIINFDEEVINGIGRTVFKDASWSIPIGYKTISSDSVGQGRVGAFAKQVELALHSVMGAGTLLEGDFEETLRIFFIASDFLFRKVRQQQDAGVLEDVEVFDLLVACSGQYREDPYYPVILDTVKAVLGNSKPKHLVSHIITDAFNQALRVINLVCINKSLVHGASKIIGGEALLKY